MKTCLKIIIAICLLYNITGCQRKGDDPDPPSPPPPPPSTVDFAKGADISWLTEMETAGKKFYNSAGTQQECMSLLKSLGMNTIRLRVWVNPAGSWNNNADVLAKATRAKNLGLRIMIDFHYSDTWADPGHQMKPSAWAGQDITALKNTLGTYTTSVLNELKNAGITPEWVQVGNETNDGMVWPEGKASTNMANFAQLVNAGYDAAKAVFPSTKVIVHVSNGWDNSLFRWLFDGLKSNGGKWDVIGMSLYPTPANWASLNSQCLTNMNDMVTRYNKEVMVVEVGMSWDQAAACNSFLADLVTKTKSVTGDKGLGVLYWEPQAYNNWQGYTLGAFDNSGKPTVAMNAFN
jgi:arabinogalactan endo-1,4-beta-galactosidase